MMRSEDLHVSNFQSNMTIGEREVIAALVGLNSSGDDHPTTIEGVHREKKQKLSIEEKEIGWESSPAHELPPSRGGAISVIKLPPLSGVAPTLHSSPPSRTSMKRSKEEESPPAIPTQKNSQDRQEPDSSPVRETTTSRRPTRVITANWLHHFEELKEFKLANRHCNVSRKNTQWKSLGHWVRQQRRKKKQDQLNQTQINLLDNLGFEWDRSYYLYTKAPYRDVTIKHDDDESYE
eukprot:TRINITY_DN3565_c0_g1_i1.p1 TRINITY_DN3565_c0_g1~~TRINITY_DN3565_c0_g1_i1.p1  ORF type:complete len:235 (-),score=41.58 TRINITY_DN3565_c0_g1_i1:116-820(-)